MPDNLNAEVARRIWGEKRTLVPRFDTDIERCRRDMLPALERRGLGAKFYEALLGMVDIHTLRRLRREHLGFSVLKLPPRAWCEAFIEAWDGGEGAK